VCAAHRAAVRIDAPRGDRSVVAAGRRYLLRLRLPRPAAVTVEGGSELASTGRDAGLPGWWMDDADFLIRVYTCAISVRPRSSRLASWWLWAIATWNS
jgi:hypothetical protein